MRSRLVITTVISMLFGGCLIKSCQPCTSDAACADDELCRNQAFPGTGGASFCCLPAEAEYSHGSTADCCFGLRTKVVTDAGTIVSGTCGCAVSSATCRFDFDCCSGSCRLDRPDAGRGQCNSPRDAG